MTAKWGATGIRVANGITKAVSVADKVNKVVSISTKLVELPHTSCLDQLASHTKQLDKKTWSKLKSEVKTYTAHATNKADIAAIQAKINAKILNPKLRNKLLDITNTRFVN